MADKECEKCGPRAMFLSAATNVGLTVIKAAIAFIADSMALLADATHSLSDIACALLGIWSQKLGKKPSNKKFPYGYGKIEFIVGIIVGLILFGLAFGILFSSLKLLFSSVAIQPPKQLALLAALLSIYANLTVSHYTLCAAKELNSPALKAISFDNRSDAFSSIPVVIAILGAQIGFPQLDPLGAVLIGLVIGKVAVQLIVENYKGLMDASIEHTVIHKMRDIILSIPEVNKIGYLRARQIGQKIWVDLQICIPANKTLTEGDEICREVRAALMRNMPSIHDVQVSAKPA